MKIKSIRIQNFRSLKNIELNDIGDLTVMIGPNNSGKTTLLEALTFFFTELSPSLDQNLGNISDCNWYDRKTNHPIEFDLTIQPTNEETSIMFHQDDIREALKIKDGVDVRIVREISGTPQNAQYKTKLLEINGIRVFPSPHTKETPTILTPELATTTVQHLSNLFRGCFYHVPAARDMPYSYTGLQQRQSIIRLEDLNEIRALGQNTGRSEMERWKTLETQMKHISPALSEVRVLGQELIIGEKNELAMPIYWNGGGHQELTVLLNRLSSFAAEKSMIFGIDEPELHLHPELARRLFDMLRSISENHQIFISTHSPIFIDKAQLNCICLARRGRDGTHLKRLDNLEDLKEVSMELGIRPSDIFVSNVIVFVEGPADRIFFMIVAKKLGIDFDSREVVFIPIYGKSKGRYYLKVWTEVTKSAGIPFFMILDKGAEKEAKTFFKEGVLKEGKNLFLLKRVDLEEYYPKDLIVKGLSDEFKLESSQIDMSLLKDGMIVQGVEEIFMATTGETPRGWKLDLARSVAKNIQSDFIEDELRVIMDRIASSTGRVS